MPRDLEIGPSKFTRRVRGWLGYGVVVAAVVGGFVYLFVLLTASWRVAVGSVGLLLGYMAVMSWWAERNTGGRDDAMR